MKVIVYIEGKNFHATLVNTSGGGVHTYSKEMSPEVAKAVGELIEPEVRKAVEEIMKQVEKNLLGS